MIKVQKRDGRIVDYDRDKIVTAIEKANAEVDTEERADKQMIGGILDYVEKQPYDVLNVEAIQDMIESSLVKQNKYILSKKYMIYRYQRALLRKANTTDESILKLIKNENKELAEENSNKNTILASTQRDYIAGEVSRDLTKRMLLPEHISMAHEQGAIHFHDADYFVQPIFNCCLINIADMLDNGTVMNEKMIESPKSFQVACTVMTQIIAAVASNQYGGQSVDMRHLGKYLRKSSNKFHAQIRKAFGDSIDEETVEKMAAIRLQDELKSGVQTIQYQINTLMTTNGQSPFVTLFLNLDENDEYIEENAAIIEEIRHYQQLQTDLAAQGSIDFEEWIDYGGRFHDAYLKTIKNHQMYETYHSLDTNRGSYFAYLNNTNSSFMMQRIQQDEIAHGAIITAMEQQDLHKLRRALADHILQVCSEYLVDENARRAYLQFQTYLDIFDLK